MTNSRHEQSTKDIFHIKDDKGNIICMTTDEEKADYISHALNVYSRLRNLHTKDYVTEHFENKVTLVEKQT